MCGRSRMQVLRAKGASIQRDQRTAESPRMVSQLGLSFLLTIIGHPAMRLSARNLLGQRVSDKSIRVFYLLGMLDPKYALDFARREVQTGDLQYSAEKRSDQQFESNPVGYTPP